MAKLVFDQENQRFYRLGVNNVVLFVKKADNSGYDEGVAWNGVTSITRSPEGAEETAVYADNIKYLSMRSPEELKGTIEALESPVEFDVCDGQAEADDTVKGVKLGQQSRRAFALCYMEKKCVNGNEDYGKLLHIIYGCTASPTEVPSETINESPEASPLSWEFSATKVDVTGHKPTAHVEIDSTVVPEAKWNKIVNTLYGTDASQGVEATDPTLLFPDAIIGILREQD